MFLAPAEKLIFLHLTDFYLARFSVIPTTHQGGELIRVNITLETNMFRRHFFPVFFLFDAPTYGFQ